MEQKIISYLLLRSERERGIFVIERSEIENRWKTLQQFRNADRSFKILLFFYYKVEPWIGCIVIQVFA